MIKTNSLKPNHRNPRKISKTQEAMLSKALEEFGDLGGVVYNRRTQRLVGGHQRVNIFGPETEITIETKYKKPTRTGTVAEGAILFKGEKFKYREVDWDTYREEAANLAANKQGGEFDDGKLKEILAELQASEMDMDLTGFDADEIEDLLAEQEEQGGQAGALANNFIAPPFSVLDTRQAYWRDRKDFWLRKGIKSEIGREDSLLMKKAQKGLNKLAGTEFSGTSIFDPVLCEIAYSWFSAKGSIVLDPFAGGSVRGIVAAELGRHYHGCDLRKEQVKENTKQADKICQGAVPLWKAGDSVEIDKHFKGLEADFIFSCPPYADLEVYSDNPKDLSTMDYKRFLEAYGTIIKKSVQMLRNDRFAVFVVGEVREKGKHGYYKNFVMDTIAAFEAAGARYYNEMILLNAVGTLALRTGKQFKSGRKVGKMHQNILVFCKGDPKKATEYCGPVEVMEITEEENAQETT